MAYNFIELCLYNNGASEIQYIHMLVYPKAYIIQCSTSELLDLFATWTGKVGIATVAIADIERAYEFGRLSLENARLVHLGLTPYNMYTTACDAMLRSYVSSMEGVSSYNMDIRSPVLSRVYLDTAQHNYTLITEELNFRLSIRDHAQIAWTFYHNR